MQWYYSSDLQNFCEIPFSIGLLIKLHKTGVITDLAILKEIPSTALEFDCISLTSFIVQALKTN